jgi:hypothetical protein
LIYEDINFDGYFDGISATGETTLKNLNMTDSILKSYMAGSIARIIQNPSLNMTGLGFSDIGSFIDGIANSNQPIFRLGSPCYPFDITLPSINCTSPSEGATISGDFSIDCAFSDTPGVDFIDVAIDNITIANSLTSYDNFQASLNTSSFSAGNKIIRIGARDKIGNLSYKYLNFKIP